MLLEEEEAMFSAAAYLQLQIMKKKKPAKKKKSIWMKNWLQRRVFYGQYEMLVTELRGEDTKGFRNYMRITPDLFQELVERVGPRLQKNGYFHEKSLGAWTPYCHHSQVHGQWRFVSEPFIQLSCSANHHQLAYTRDV